MKITKSQLKQIIKEELEEVLDDREVQVPGFGKLTLKQIEKRLVDMLKEAGEGAMKDPPDFYNLKTGMIQAFYKAYKTHKSEEQISEASEASAVQISVKHGLSMQIAKLIVDLKKKTGASDEEVIQMIADFQGVDRADAITAANLAKTMMDPEESGRLDEAMDMESLKILLDVLQKMVQPGEIESMLAGAGALGGAAAYQIGKLRKGK